MPIKIIYYLLQNGKAYQSDSVKQMVQFLLWICEFYTPLLSPACDGTKLVGTADCQTVMFLDIMFANCFWNQVKMWHTFPLNTAGVKHMQVRKCRIFQLNYQNVFKTSIVITLASCFTDFSFYISLQILSLTFLLHMSACVTLFCGFFVIYLHNSWSIIKVYSLCWLKGSVIAIHQIAFLPK